MKHAIMYFDTEFNLGRSFNPNKWINYRIDYYDDGQKALFEIMHANKLTTQLVSADTDEELQNEIRKMKKKFSSRKWITNMIRHFFD